MQINAPTVILALAVASALWASAAECKPAPGDVQSAVPATIAQLRAAPETFAGKIVQLAGQLDECVGWECSLCPETMVTATADPEQCLALEFRSLIPDTGFGSSEKEKFFRFSSVVLTATFDPGCLQGGCLDRPVVLRSADVLAVIQRRPAQSGLWLGEQTPLVQIGEPLLSELAQAADDADFTGGPYKAFRAEGSDSRATQEAIICSTRIESEPGAWPTTVQAAFAGTTRDFYQCRTIAKRRGRWVVLVR